LWSCRRVSETGKEGYALKIAVIVLITLLLIGCTAETENAPEIPTETAAENEITVSSEPSEDVGLPEEMPDDFEISYSWWIGGKNTLDTYENYIEKDLVFDGTVIAEYFPDEAEMKALYRILFEHDISGIDREMTSAVLATDDSTLHVEPCTYYAIKFTADGKIYHITGDATAWGYRDSDKDAGAFCAFNNEMNQFFRETDEYKSLPEPEGGYM